MIKSIGGKKVSERRTRTEEIIAKHLEEQISDLTNEEKEKCIDLMLRVVTIYSRPELESLRKGVENLVLDFVRGSRREYWRYSR